MKKEEGIKVSNIVLIITLFLFLILIGRVSYIALSKKVDDINIQKTLEKEFAKNRTLTVISVAGTFVLNLLCIVKKRNKKN